MINLTREEHERRTYIEGRVAEAALVAAAIDGDEDYADHLRHENDMLKDELRLGELVREDLTRAEDEVAYLKAKLEKVREVAA